MLSSSLQALGETSDGLSNLPGHFAYLLTIHLKEGRNLVVRDRCGKTVLSGAPWPVPLSPHPGEEVADPPFPCQQGSGHTGAQISAFLGAGYLQRTI